ncbi:MAG: ribbon-helix-helix domain-containing protein [Promethearchaeota archaeon]
MIKIKLVTVHLPEGFISGLDRLVDDQKYPNRSEVIRIAIRDLLKKELWESLGFPGFPNAQL